MSSPSPPTPVPPHPLFLSPNEVQALLRIRPFVVAANAAHESAASPKHLNPEPTISSANLVQQTNHAESEKEREDPGEQQREAGNEIQGVRLDGESSGLDSGDQGVSSDARSRVACGILRSVLSDPSALARCFRSPEVEVALQPIFMRLCAW